MPAAPVTGATSAPETPAPPARARYRDVLKRRELWGVIVARLVSDPVWFFFIYWEPGYLQERLGMSLDELARIGWIPKAAATATLIVLGFASDRLIAKLRWQPARSRRVILQALAGLAPVLLVLPFASNHILAIVLLCLVRVMMVVWLNFTNLLMADLVPANLIGTAVALMSAFGAATSLLANLFVGPVLDRVGYGVVFTAGACLHPLAAFILWKCYGRRPRPAANLQA
jgi:ACS family hexuronate transporter-like MFS transporter